MKEEGDWMMLLLRQYYNCQSCDRKGADVSVELSDKYYGFYCKDCLQDIWSDLVKREAVYQLCR